MNVSIYYGLSKPLPADNSHVYRWSSHDNMKEWLNRYSAGKISYEINTIFPTDGGFIDAPLSFEKRPDYVVCEIATTVFCYFATSIQYLAENSTRVFLSVDAWGTFYGIGDSVSEKFGKTHIVQGHYNRADLLRTPAVATLQSNFDYLAPNDDEITKYRRFIFPEYMLSNSCSVVLIFASENSYKTFIITTDSGFRNIYMSKTFAIEKCRDANKINRFDIMTTSGEVTGSENLNALVSAYIIPKDIFNFSLNDDEIINWRTGKLVNNSLTSGTEIVYYAYMVTTEKFITFRDTTTLYNYGNSHFIQIGAKIFDLPQTGKYNNFRVNTMITADSFKTYFTVDEQTEEITEQFAMTVFADTAKNYWNQNATSVALQMTASAIGAVGSIATGNVIGAVGSTLAIGQQTANIVSRLKQPCKISGTPSFLYTSIPQLRCGAEFSINGINHYSVVYDINNRGFAIDTWRDNPEIDNHPFFFEINNDGTENKDKYIYSQFVQTDFLTMKNSICPIASVDRLRSAFFAGLVVHHEWQNGIL